MTLLSLRDLTVQRGECPVVDRVSLEIGTGECVGLIGPNGAGKTTLMRAALGLLPHQGQSNLSTLPARDRAKSVAWMPQTRDIAWPVSVEHLVALGRLPHLPLGQKLGDTDQQAVDAALSHMGLDSFRNRRATELSGGEQARVLIARALAQETPLLMADEPIAGLDPAAQIATLAVFAKYAQDGHSVLTSLHDLSLAARYCTRLILMARGGLVADGPPDQVLTEDNLAHVFHLRAKVHQTEDGPIFQPLGVIE